MGRLRGWEIQKIRASEKKSVPGSCCTERFSSFDADTQTHDATASCISVRSVKMKVARREAGISRHKLGRGLNTSQLLIMIQGWRWGGGSCGGGVRRGSKLADAKGQLVKVKYHSWLFKTSLELQQEQTQTKQSSVNPTLTGRSSVTVPLMLACQQRHLSISAIFNNSPRTLLWTSVLQVKHGNTINGPHLHAVASGLRPSGYQGHSCMTSTVHPPHVCNHLCMTVWCVWHMTVCHPCLMALERVVGYTVGKWLGQFDPHWLVMLQSWKQCYMFSPLVFSCFFLLSGWLLVQMDVFIYSICDPMIDWRTVALPLSMTSLTPGKDFCRRLVQIYWKTMLFPTTSTKKGQK